MGSERGGLSRPAQTEGHAMTAPTSPTATGSRRRRTVVAVLGFKVSRKSG
jgi:hypothetical protein